MSGFQQVLDSQKLLAAEIQRVERLVKECKATGNEIDDPSDYLQILTDARDGIVRCYSCGRVKAQV